MGKVIRFSEIEGTIDSIGAGLNGSFLDTNFLIGLLHNEHEFNKSCEACFKILAEKKCKLYVTHTIKVEFLDFQRRYLLSKKLEEVSRGAGHWYKRTSPAFKAFALAAIQTIEEESRIKMLVDKEIKKLRQKIYPSSNGMLVGWVAFCNFFLNSDLNKSWRNVIDTLGVNYLNLRSEELAEGSYLLKKVDWDDMIKIVGSTGVGTHDAMIVNAFNCSKFEIIISTDLDVAYAIGSDKKNTKVCALPDDLYDRHQKNIFSKF